MWLLFELHPAAWGQGEEKCPEVSQRRQRPNEQIKAKKKKWSKSKVQDEPNNLVLFDKATQDKLCTEVPNYTCITPAVVCDRLKIPGSLARTTLQELLSKGLIQLVSKHRAQAIHTRHTNKPSCWWRRTTGTTRCTFWKIKLYSIKKGVPGVYLEKLYV